LFLPFLELALPAFFAANDRHLLDATAHPSFLSRKGVSLLSIEMFDLRPLSSSDAVNTVQFVVAVPPLEPLLVKPASSAAWGVALLVVATVLKLVYVAWASGI